MIPPAFAMRVEGVRTPSTPPLRTVASCAGIWAVSFAVSRFRVPTYPLLADVDVFVARLKLAPAAIAGSDLDDGAVAVADAVKVTAGGRTAKLSPEHPTILGDFEASVMRQRRLE